MKKRVLSLFLAALMILTALPALVFSSVAEEPSGDVALDQTKALASLYAEGASVLLLAYNAKNDAPKS